MWTNLKISFATDSRINRRSKSSFSVISKKRLVLPALSLVVY